MGTSSIKTIVPVRLSYHGIGPRYVCSRRCCVLPWGLPFSTRAQTQGVSMGNAWLPTRTSHHREQHSPTHQCNVLVSTLTQQNALEGDLRPDIQTRQRVRSGLVTYLRHACRRLHEISSTGLTAHEAWRPTLCCDLSQVLA